MSKEAIVVILDVSTSMRDAMAIWKGHLEAFVAQKILEDRNTDALGVIWINSPETDNPLATEDEFRGIKVVLPLSKAEYSHCKACYQVEEISVAEDDGQERTDYVDGIIVAADGIINLTEGKPYGTKRIILLSDLADSNDINHEGLEEIISRLAEAKIQLDLWQIKDVNKCANDTTQSSFEILASLVKQLGGKVKTIDENSLVRFEGKKVRQAITFRGSMSLIRGAFSIPVNIYIKTMLQRLPIARKMHDFEEKIRHVSVDVSEQSGANDLVEGPDSNSLSFNGKKNLIRAFRYARTLVPLSDIDIQSLFYRNEKDFSIVGFVPAEQLSPHASMSNCAVVAAGTEEGFVRMRALVEALKRKKWEL